MPRRYVVLIGVLLAMLLVWFGGCEQAEDILTPIGTSVVHLDAQRFPTTPSGMVYELWATRWTTNTRSALDTVSLGKFAYDFDDDEYLEIDRSPRADSNAFRLNDDILAQFTNPNNGRTFFKYRNLMVSVETASDPDPSSPANIMLIDTVSVTSNDPVNMEVPLQEELWAATVRFNMETPSDGRTAASDGQGIWLANYSQQLDTLRDTLGYSFTITRTEREFPESTSVTYLDTIINVDPAPVTVDRVFGLDTLEQLAIRRELVFKTDSTRPFTWTEVEEIWDVGSELDTVIFDQFTQDKFEFPIYDAYGFHYKGWVVTPHVAPSAGTFTPPAWLLAGNTLYDVFPGADGGMVTTGTFSRVDEPDDANPFVASGKTPPFPGEDFITNLPAGAPAPLQLIPSGSTVNGTAFITLEPINYTGRKTNFPLIAFARALPTSRSAVEATTQSFTMNGWMQSNDPFRGFPTVQATFERF